MAEKQCDYCGDTSEKGLDKNGYWFCDECTTPIECRGCSCEFTISEFEGIDDEYDEFRKLCPSCGEKAMIAGKTCEYCDQPATVYYDNPLCDDCAEQYHSD